MAAAGTGAVASRTAGTTATPGPARLLQGHPRRPAWRADPGGAPRLPGFHRGACRRICLRRRTGAAERTLNPPFPAESNPENHYLADCLTRAGEARSMGAKSARLRPDSAII